MNKQTVVTSFPLQVFPNTAIRKAGISIRNRDSFLVYYNCIVFLAHKYFQIQQWVQEWHLEEMTEPQLSFIKKPRDEYTNRL